MAPHLDSVHMMINEYWTGKDAEGSAGNCLQGVDYTIMNVRLV